MATRSVGKKADYSSSPLPTLPTSTIGDPDGVEPVRETIYESSDSSDSRKSNNCPTSTLSGRTFRKKKIDFKQQKLSKIDVSVFKPINQNNLLQSVELFINQLQSQNIKEGQLKDAILLLWPRELAEGYVSNLKLGTMSPGFHGLRRYAQRLSDKTNIALELNLWSTEIPAYLSLIAKADALAYQLKQPGEELQKFLAYIQLPRWAQEKVRPEFNKSYENLISCVRNLYLHGETSDSKGSQQIYTNSGNGQRKQYNRRENGGYSRKGYNGRYQRDRMSSNNNLRNHNNFNNPNRPGSGNYNRNNSNGNHTFSNTNNNKSNSNYNNGNRPARKPELCFSHQRYGDNCWPERCQQWCARWRNSANWNVAAKPFTPPQTQKNSRPDAQ